MLYHMKLCAEKSKNESKGSKKGQDAEGRSVLPYGAALTVLFEHYGIPSTAGEVFHPTFQNKINAPFMGWLNYVLVNGVWVKKRVIPADNEDEDATELEDSHQDHTIPPTTTAPSSSTIPPPPLTPPTPILPTHPTPPSSVRDMFLALS
ncbi:hypothetical protein L1049_007852 [Liquidambar formosana]|uniref:Uncharacterized protein n=1 Tax=Liquidambar formosana TaxID=63359 RepID=A0AAP0S532_LIQFO